MVSAEHLPGALGDEAVGRGAEVLVQVAGGVHHVADVLQGQVAVGEPRRDHGLGHHPDQQDALAGERPDQVEEAVEQVAAEDVAGHVPGRRHPLQRGLGEQVAGQHRVGELEAERVGDVGVDLERVPEAELPVLEAGLLGEVLVEQLAGGDGVRGLDGVGGGEVVVLAGVDDDAGAGVHLAAEALVDERADRVDVAEEDPVHRVVEHHVEPLETGQGRDLGHAQPAGVVGQPDVAAELPRRLVEGGPHQPEVLLRGVGAREALAGRALGHEVEQALPGRADHRDDVGALAGGGLGLRDVLVDVAGRDDQVDPRLRRGVADPGDQPLALLAAGVDALDARAHLAAGRGGGARRRPGPPGRRNRTEPADAFSASSRRSAPSPRRTASQTGSATPCSRPTSARTQSTRRLTQGVPSASAPSRPASRSVARSTDTVVCCWAIRTIGRPTLRASAARLADGGRVEVEGAPSGSCVGRHHSLRSNRRRTPALPRSSSRAYAAWPGV